MIGKFGPWLAMIIAFVPAILKIVSAVKVLISVLKILGAVLMWQQGLGAIIVLVIALAIIIYKNWDKITAFIRETYLKIMAWSLGILQNIKTWWNDTVQSVADFWIGVWNGVVEWFNDTVQSVVDFWTGVWDSVVNWCKDIINKIAQWFWDKVFAVVKWWNDTVAWFKELPSKIRNWFFNEIINPIFSGVVTKFNELTNKINEWKTNAMNAFQAVGDFFHNIFEGVGNFFDDIFGGISDRINSLKQWASSINPFSNSGGDSGNFVTNGIKSAVGSIKSMVGLATGGYVKTKGVALLHPNEVVVNDKLTQGLEAFLNDYQQLRNITSPVINISNTTPVRLPAENNDNNNTGLVTSYVSNNNTYNSVMNSTKGDTVTNNSNSAPQDNRVIFESGSVVFNVDKNTDLSDEGLKAMADKLMTIMSRKLQLRGLQTRA